MNYVTNYLNVINYSFITPYFMINKTVYLVFNLLIIFLTITAVIKYNYYSKKLLLVILINLILEILFNIFFLLIVSPFFLFATKTIQFIFSLNLNEEIYYNKTSAKLLIPYILWSFILCLYTIIILFLNR